MRQPAIEIVPVGKVPPHLLQPLPQALAEIFPVREVRNAPQGLKHPGYAFSPERKQYQADLILEQLARFDPQAERILGVADLDLFVPGLNFIFGQAQVGGPAAVIAIARLRQEFWGNPLLVQERVLKEAVHELGHTYGLEHCRIPTCVMHFSNTLEETDLKSDRFCPKHQTQLSQSLGDDRAKKD